MEFVNLSTQKTHLHQLYVILELIVMEQETVFQILFQLFVILIIIVMEMETVYQILLLLLKFVHLGINLMVMEIVFLKILL